MTPVGTVMTRDIAATSHNGAGSGCRLIGSGKLGGGADTFT